MRLRLPLVCVAVALTLTLCVAESQAVGISDLVWWGADMLAGSATDAADGGQRDGSDSESAASTSGATVTGAAGPRRTCHCSGPACMCCLDFNMTYIDLGGPGCVRLRYLGQDAGVAMNVSYGDSLLHSEVVKDSSPSQTCMDILSSLAQVCARFSSLEPLEAETESEADAVKRGCLQLEPTLLGEVQASYSVGCFRMTPQAMSVEPQPQAASPPASQPEAEGAQSGTATTEAPSPTSEMSAESLIAAVSETAEQGIDLLTNWLGLALEDDNATTTESAEAASTDSTPAPAGARAYRQGWVSVA